MIITNFVSIKQSYFMKNTIFKKWAVGSMMLLGLAACTSQEVTQGNLNVIPLPQEVSQSANEAPFVINSSTTICFPQGNEKLERTAHFLASYIKEVTGTIVQIGTEGDKNSIQLVLDDTIAEKEGYQLDVTADKIIVKGSTEVGIFYGIQTIHKALPVTNGNSLAAIPAGTVKDYPNFEYRGFMIDVGRHFFSVDYLKEVIDMLAMHNINYFHWHLTEDQGWRIEIKKYPNLTKVGSYRKGTLIKRGGNEYDNIPVSGFYTQEEAKEIVRYAAERFITVIPEIDMPGHMSAALVSYPELGCTGGPYEIPLRFGVFKDVLCGGNDKTLQFAKDVLEEIMDIFPSKYIHIGGDECPKKEWVKCPKCQAKIRQLHLKSTPQHSKENQLQAYFMGEVEKVIIAHGRKMMGWDEILYGNPSKTSTVMAWTNPKATVRSAQLGHKTINCPIQYLYFSNPHWNELRGVNSVARVYNYNIVPDELSEADKKNVIGTQGCIWTEWTKDSLKMEWQLMPRLAALSELQWSNPQKKNLDCFLKRLQHQLDVYTAHGYHFKQDIFEATINFEEKEDSKEATVTMETYDKVPVYYTLDGSEPTASSTRYEKPFSVTDGTTVKAIAVRETGKPSPVSEATWKAKTENKK